MENKLKFRGLECIVYLDSYKKVGDGVVDAYIDFRLDKDFALFRRSMNYPETTATYIELQSLKTSKRLFQGCYYKLNLDLLKNYQFERNDDSLLIGASFDVGNMPAPTDNADELLQSHELLDPEDLSMSNVPRNVSFNVNAQSGWELFVKNVGQANWNELRSGDRVEVVYDAGAELQASATEVTRIFNSRKTSLEQSKPILVISHWDKDHIHCLKYLTNQDISNCFSKLICVDKLRSITSSGILTRFKTVLGTQNVFCLPLPARTNGIDMHRWRCCGDVAFYQGERSRNINYCGLVMFVHGSKATASLTGDCKLSQAKDVYKQEKARGINTNEHILVAPHHGGDYGASSRFYDTPCDNILISVGAGNTYGHPQKDMKSYLESLGTVERTDEVGDIVKDL